MGQIISEKMRIPFKGTREYLQGADLVNVVLAYFKNDEIHGLKINIHDFIDSNICEIVVALQDDEPLGGELKGSIKTDKGEFKYSLRGVDESSGETERVQFDETKVTTLCKLDENKITLDGNMPYSFTETVVSMYKYILNQQYPTDNGRWIFTGLDFECYSLEMDSPRVEIIHNFQNKLVKADIFSNERRVGYMYFSQVKSS